MPYTLVHPFFLLWSKKKFSEISISAIVIASIVPDLDILLRLTDTRIHIFQYTLKEIFLFMLPMCFCLWLYYEAILKNILSPIFPLLQTKDFSYKEYFFVYFTMIVAIYLHLFLDLISHWDAFSLFMIVGWNTGNKVLAGLAYLYALYGNAILFSALGLFLVYKYSNLRALLNFRPNKLQKKYLLLFSFFTIIFFFFKLLFAVKEKLFFIDILVINFTGALIFSFFVTPLIYFILHKLNLINAQSGS